MEGKLLRRKEIIIVLIMLLFLTCTGCHRKSNIYGNKNLETENYKEESLDNLPRFKTSSENLIEEYIGNGFNIEKEGEYRFVRQKKSEIEFEMEDALGVGVLNITIDDIGVLKNTEELEALHNILAVFFIKEYNGYDSQKIEEVIKKLEEEQFVSEFVYNDEAVITAQYFQDKIDMRIHPKY